MRNQRRKFSAQQKVKILRQHLVEKAPSSSRKKGDMATTVLDKSTMTCILFSSAIWKRISSTSRASPCASAVNVSSIKAGVFNNHKKSKPMSMWYCISLAKSSNLLIQLSIDIRRCSFTGSADFGLAPRRWFFAHSSSSLAVCGLISTVLRYLITSMAPVWGPVKLRAPLERSSSVRKYPHPC